MTMPTFSLAGIETKFLGPTNTRGARVKAQRTDHRQGDPTHTQSWNHAWDSHANHANAALILAEKLEWTDRTWTGAGTPKGYVFAQAAR